MLNPATGVIRQLPYGDSTPGAISGANVTAIAEDGNGYMWLATDGQAWIWPVRWHRSEGIPP